MHVGFSVACASLLVAGGLAVACSPSKAEPAAPDTAVKTWGGDLTPVVSVKELMHDLIDPLSDNIFDAVGSEVTAAGSRDWAPRTDEEWAKVRIGGVAMAEASYLLKVPRLFEPTSDTPLAKYAETGVLSPAEIKAKLEKDPVLWQAKVEALRNVGRAVLDAVAQKDTTALMDAAENLDAACEGCHLEFWYPSQ